MSKESHLSSSSSPKDSAVKSIEMPPPSNNNKKRKRSIVRGNEVPVRISAAPPTNVALPPPLVSYHPHLVPSYYPVYHHHPYYLSVGQPPISPNLSPAPPSPTTNQSNNQSRILPKSPSATPTTMGYFPYPMQISPQLHPTQQQPGSLSPVPYHPVGGSSIRHNSMSSSGSTTTTTTTTADQREQARKVSHSAIERRRRERINDKIGQLKDLIPACADRENLHKMTILENAIEYITYLKKVIQDLDKDGTRQKPQEANKETAQEDDTWSQGSSSSHSTVPTSALKPKDIIQLNKTSQFTTPPKIIVGDRESEISSNVDKHMNLENILC